MMSNIIISYLYYQNNGNVHVNRIGMGRKVTKNEAERLETALFRELGEKRLNAGSSAFLVQWVWGTGSIAAERCTSCDARLRRVRFRRPSPRRAA